MNVHHIIPRARESLIFTSDVHVVRNVFSGLHARRKVSRVLALKQEGERAGFALNWNKKTDNLCDQQNVFLRPATYAYILYTNIDLRAAQFNNHNNMNSKYTAWYTYPLSFFSFNSCMIHLLRTCIVSCHQYTIPPNNADLQNEPPGCQRNIPLSQSTTERPNSSGLVKRAKWPPSRTTVVRWGKKPPSIDKKPLIAAGGQV